MAIVEVIAASVVAFCPLVTFGWSFFTPRLALQALAGAVTWFLGWWLCSVLYFLFEPEIQSAHFVSLYAPFIFAVCRYGYILLYRVSYRVWFDPATGSFPSYFYNSVAVGFGLGACSALTLFLPQIMRIGLGPAWYFAPNCLWFSELLIGSWLSLLLSVCYVCWSVLGFSTLVDSRVYSMTIWSVAILLHVLYAVVPLWGSGCGARILGPAIVCIISVGLTVICVKRHINMKRRVGAR